jgi:hypothetical protein
MCFDGLAALLEFFTQFTADFGGFKTPPLFI